MGWRARRLRVGTLLRRAGVVLAAASVVLWVVSLWGVFCCATRFRDSDGPMLLWLSVHRGMLNGTNRLRSDWPGGAHVYSMTPTFREVRWWVGWPDVWWRSGMAYKPLGWSFEFNVPIWIPCAAGLGLMAGGRLLTREWRVRPGVCRGCGHALFEGRCPECGYGYPGAVTPSARPPSHHDGSPRPPE